MSSRKEAQRNARQLLRLSLTNGVLDEAKVSQIVKQVVEKKPRNTIGILEAFANLVRLEKAKRHAVIESAELLDDSTREKIESELNAKYGQLEFEYQVKPELLGGIRAKVGSDVWDGSVKARLDALRQQFA